LPSSLQGLWSTAVSRPRPHAVGLSHPVPRTMSESDKSPKSNEAAKNKIFTWEDIEVLELMKAAAGIICPYPLEHRWCNKGWLKLWGCRDFNHWMEKGEMNRKGMSEGHKKVMRSMQNSVCVERKKKSTSQTIYPDGVPYTLNMQMSPIDIKEPDGKVKTWMLAEEVMPDTGTVAEERRRIEGFNYANTMITIFNPQGDILCQNPRAKEYYEELKKAGHIGNNPLQSILRQKSDYNDLLFRCSDKLRGSWKKEISMPPINKELNGHAIPGTSTSASGSDTDDTVWHDIRAVYSQDPVSGKPSVIMNQSDITELKRLQEKVIKMQEERFRRIAVEKDRFFAGVSHELRTPLNGIIGLSDDLMRNEDDKEIGICDEHAKKHLEMINNCGKRLLNLVNDILDMSKLKEKKTSLNNHKFDFKDAVKEVLKMLEHHVDLKRGIKYKAKQVKLVNKCQSVLIEADRERCTQVLFNLAGNALKFTKEGSVSIISEIVDDGKTLQICVEDTGIGIKEKHLDKIFTVFEQADNASSREYSGTGLGLPLSEALVKLHGGKMWVKSEFGKGSQFFFTLPLKFQFVVHEAKAQKSKRKEEAEEIERMKKAEISVPKSTTATPVPIPGKKTALGMIDEVPMEKKVSPKKVEKPRPAAKLKDVARLDAMVDSVMAHNQRRQSGGGTLTAHEVPRAEDHAYVFSISKKEDPSKKEEKTKKKYTVLSVDDDPVNQMVMTNVLRAAGYKVRKAMNGFEALDLIKEAFQKFEKGEVDKDIQTPGDHIPDVILLDVMMPGMSGYKVAEHLRCKYPTRALPIIMVSAKSAAESIATGLQHGANDYVSKPFKKVELLARVRTQIQLKQTWQKEMREAEELRLLHRILPVSVTSRLLQGEHLIADSLDGVTILFADIVGFHALASEMSTPNLILLLNEIFAIFDKIAEKCGVQPVSTLGDTYMAVCGHDGENQNDHAVKVVRFSVAILKAIAKITHSNGKHVKIKVGIHSGPAYAGVVGLTAPRYCFFGETVAMAHMLNTSGIPSCVQVSKHTYKEVSGNSEWNFLTRTMEMLDEKEDKVFVLPSGSEGLRAANKALKTKTKLLVSTTLYSHNRKPPGKEKAELQRKLREAMDEVNRMRAEVNEKEDKLLKLKEIEVTCRKRLTMVDTLKGELDSKESEITRSQRKLTESTVQIRQLEDDLRSTKEELRRAKLAIEVAKSRSPERASRSPRDEGFYNNPQAPAPRMSNGVQNPLSTQPSPHARPRSSPTSQLPHHHQDEHKDMYAAQMVIDSCMCSVHQPINHGRPLYGY